MESSRVGRRIIIAGCIALGLGGLSVALGMLYLDFVRREGAWVEAGMRQHESLSTDEQARILSAWRDRNSFLPALVAGSAGVAVLGFGVTLGVFELRIFNKPTLV